jgi:hypothetical protein
LSAHDPTVIFPQQNGAVVVVIADCKVMSRPKMRRAKDLPVEERRVFLNICIPDNGLALFRTPFDERFARMSFFISLTPDLAMPFERGV